MPQRRIGRNGPLVSAIGYGAMGLSAFYGSVASDEERFKVLDRLLDLGITLIDSSDIYGDNEELLGKYFKKYPEKRAKVKKIVLVFNRCELKITNFLYDFQGYFSN